jgi:hypothetical protein
VRVSGTRDKGEILHAISQTESTKAEMYRKITESKCEYVAAEGLGESASGRRERRYAAAQVVKARTIKASSKHLVLASAAARDGGIVDLKIAKG